MVKVEKEFAQVMFGIQGKAALVTGATGALGGCEAATPAEAREILGLGLTII